LGSVKSRFRPQDPAATHRRFERIRQRAIERAEAERRRFVENAAAQAESEQRKRLARAPAVRSARARARAASGRPAA
jgi:hypothetical protein